MKINRFVTKALFLSAIFPTGFLCALEFNYDKPLREPSIDLGWQFAPSQQTNLNVAKEGKTIQSVIYTSDQFGRRTTPADKSESGETEFMLFLRSNNIFGERLNMIAETVPVQTASFLPNFTPYNYAFVAYGPNQMLSMLRTRDLKKEVKEPNGILVYSYSWYENERAVGGPHFF